MTRMSVIGWIRGERGNIALLFALMLPMVIGGAALGVETTYWYLTRLQMQSAADAAAYAGAMEKRAGGSNANVLTVATKAATDNGWTSGNGTITVNAPPTSGTSGNRAVEVIINTTATRFFTAYFTGTDVAIRARAVAKYTPAGTACVLALSYTASRAAKFSGNGTTTLTACSVMANSTASDAIYTGGSTVLTTECLISVGGISNGGTVNKTCDETVTQAPPVSDPFANYVWPAYNGVTDNGRHNGNGAQALTPGRYTNSQGVDLKSANVTLTPGNYFFDYDVTINAGAVVSCPTCGTTKGVTLFFGPNAKLTMNGNATVNLQAPPQLDNSLGQSVTGMLIVADPSNTQNFSINGTATSSLTGDIYMKKANVDVAGNFSGQGGCMHVVADTVNWTGNSTVSANCTGYGMIEIPGAYTVRLSE